MVSVGLGDEIDYSLEKSGAAVVGGHHPWLLVLCSNQTGGCTLLPDSLWLQAIPLSLTLFMQRLCCITWILCPLSGPARGKPSLQEQCLVHLFVPPDKGYFLNEWFSLACLTVPMYLLLCVLV